MEKVLDVGTSKEADDFTKSILVVTSEARPFCATGGLADVCGSLPKYLKKAHPGCDVRVVMPFYKNLAMPHDKFTYVGYTFVRLSWRNEYCGVFKYELDGVIFYFIDNERYFGRDGYYGFMDDGERFAFFSLAALAMMPVINFYPDIIHANDWQSALTPLYLRVFDWKDDRYYRMKSVITIHNILYQGRFSRQMLGDVIAIDSKDYGNLLHYDDVNLIKGAMLCADRVTTVSKSYANEIQTPEGGNGLDGVARHVSYKLWGIVNGLDENQNPKTDDAIFAKFDANHLEGKAKNKEELQKYFGLEVNPDAPILAVVSRMVKNKGFDLIRETMEGIINTTNAQFVAVGEGDKEYEDYFKYLNSKYPSRVHVSLGFSTEIGKLIYAGSDIYLMPSISEPCGLSQLIASKYGSVPVVREVGGLKDTIRDFGWPDGGNGYTFRDYSARDFDYSVRRAINDYKNKEEWTKKVKIVMGMDFSWNRSAEEYVKMYKEM